HDAADRKRDLVPSQVKLFPSVDLRAGDEAAVKAVVRDDLLNPRGLPVLKPRVAELDYRRYRSDGAGDLGALVWNAARRQAVAHRERELGFDADREEIARRNFRRRIEASRRQDTRRERPGRSDQRLRLLRGASDFVAGDWQAALSDKRFLDRIGVVQRQRRAARRQPFDRPPVAARGGDRGHRFFEIVRRYHLHSMKPAVPGRINPWLEFAGAAFLGLKSGMTMRIADAVNIDDLRRLARRRLPRVVFDFIEGGVEDEHGLEVNETSFARRRLVPRYLVDISR